MDLRLLLAVFVAIFGCCYAEVDVEEENMFSCVGNYLKSQNQLDKEFYVPEVLNATDCDARLVMFREVFYAGVMDALKNDDQMKNGSECIIDELKNLNIADESMKRLFYEKSKKVLKRKQNKAIEAIDYAMKKKMTTVVKLCMFKSTFDAGFAMLYSKGQSGENHTEEEKIEDYCIRKHMTEGNFIDSNIYRVNLNPDNIDVTSADCDGSLKGSAEKITNRFKQNFEGVSEETEKCLITTLTEHKIFETNIKVVLLGEIGLTEEAVEVEKKIFIEKMSQVYDGIFLCLL